MQYVVKVYARGGGVYRTPVPYATREEAQVQYDSEHLYGRFYRAEIWSGTFTNETWTDGEMLASKTS